MPLGLVLDSSEAKLLHASDVQDSSVDVLSTGIESIRDKPRHCYRQHLLHRASL